MVDFHRPVDLVKSNQGTGRALSERATSWPYRPWPRPRKGGRSQWGATSWSLTTWSGAQSPFDDGWRWRRTGGENGDGRSGDQLARSPPAGRGPVDT